MTSDHLSSSCPSIIPASSAAVPAAQGDSGEGTGRAAPIKTPKQLSPRIQWLRDFYFQGTRRSWNNEYTSWTTGTSWDTQFQELTYYIVPEVYPLLQTMSGSYKQAARPVALPSDFWRWSLVERRSWFIREVMVHYLPQEILPGDLLAGSRFNIQTSLCLTRSEQRQYDRLVQGRGGVRAQVKSFHDHGYGNAGATSGHLIPDHRWALSVGWKTVHQDLEEQYGRLTSAQRRGPRGAQIRAMMTSATMARDWAAKLAQICRQQAQEVSEPTRREELTQMAANLDRVPWEPAKTFWEAVQALWINHALVMADENYPGPGVSFGRVDQYLLPYYQQSLAEGMDREFAKEILKCFWFHCNTAYDAQIRSGNQGITAGFGQLVTLSGMGPGGRDMTNELTYLILEVIDEMSPILEPKPNVRIHRGSPDDLLDRVVAMIASSQGAPFLLNFDERSMAGLILQAEQAGLQSLIHPDNVHDYAPVGCMENTMVGNDRSGTVDNNLNLVKAVELALGGGRDLVPAQDAITGQPFSITQDGPDSGDPRTFTRWEQFWEAYCAQTRYIIARCVEVHEASEAIRARFFPTPYLSCLVQGCADSGKDVTQGGARISLTTLEAVTYATTVDSLLAIKFLVFDNGLCTMDELIEALRHNWEGHQVLQARARNKAPKYGQDEDEADQMAKAVMDLWCQETWNHQTRSTGRRYRPGMLSWNYWAGDGYVVAASADGRPKGRFLSNAICPSNGADVKGPTSNTNSVGKVLGGKVAPDNLSGNGNGSGNGSDSAKGNGSGSGNGNGSDSDIQRSQPAGNSGNSGNSDHHFLQWRNCLPNGASHTMTFHPSLLRSEAHREAFKAFLRGYVENGGTALQVNVLDPETLKEAQRHPGEYRHLLVRITGYNAYFTSIGRELQDEVIARLSHRDL